MSTAWYKPHAAPKLLRSFPLRKKILHAQRSNGVPNNQSEICATVEVWNTTCIVRNFGRKDDNVQQNQQQLKSSLTQTYPGRSVLINSSNPTLLGVRKFPYFPRGGPVPSQPPLKYEHHIMGYVTQWGGMEVKDGMLFPFNVVDGLVHELGGWKLAWHCYMMKDHENGGEKGVKCPIGHAVITPPGGKDLEKSYDAIVHTVPPFYEYPEGEFDADPSELLANCYRKALLLCMSSESIDADKKTFQFMSQGRYEKQYDGEQASQLQIASPLLGAGGRGFPIGKAIEVAAVESLRWRNNVFENIPMEHRTKKLVLKFGIPQLEIAQKLIDAISNECKENESDFNESF